MTPTDPDRQNFTGVLCDIASQVKQGTRLDAAAATALFEEADLLELGALAQQETRRRWGPAVYFSLNQHINYTNVCRYRCRFCHFCRGPGAADAYVLTATEVADRAAVAASRGATEVHIVGGVHPELPTAFYYELLRAVRRACPEVFIKAFTAVEVAHLAEKAGQSIESVLAGLRQAGLDALTGGGAEILDAAYFHEVCPGKPGPDAWATVHRAAHRQGLPTHATMLFGYRETVAQRVAHLLAVRALQDEALADGAGRFLCFVPLPYCPPAGAEPAGAVAPGAVDELRTIAVARLVLDNVAAIKAFWPMLGLELAQTGLAFGANDLDGTVGDYEIVPVTGARSLTAERLVALVREAGREPVQRDGWYRPLAPVVPGA